MEDLKDYLSADNWLLSNGLVTETLKDDIFMYGAIVHETAVLAVEADLDVKTKLVTYRLYCDSSFIKKYNKFNELRKSTSVWGLWRFSRLIKKNGNLDFAAVLKRYVTDRCGKGWSVNASVHNIKTYKGDATSDGNKEKI